MRTPTPSSPGPCLLLPLADQTVEAGFWEALKEWVALPDTPKPVVVLVSEVQLDEVPRSLDKVAGLTVREAAPGMLAPLILQTVEAGGLVAEPAWRRAQVPFAQWLALRWKSGWQEAPIDWRSTWKATSRLPDLPKVKLRLVDLDFEMAAKAPPLPEGPGLRDYVVDLIRGTADALPPVRLRHAQQLGIEAGATAAEVAACQQRREDATFEQCAKKAGIAVQRLEPAELQDLLHHARYRATRAVVRVRDMWHWLNVSPPKDVPPSRIKAHTVEVQPTAVDRLWAEVEGWTAADLEADPWMAAVVARLDPKGADALAFRLARLWLLLDGLPNGWPVHHPAPEQITDPLPALRAMLGRPNPPAELCLMPTDNTAWTSRPVSDWQDESLGISRVPAAGKSCWLGRGQLLLCFDASRAVYRRCWNDKEDKRLSSFVPSRRPRLGGGDVFAQALHDAISGHRHPEASVGQDGHRVQAPSDAVWLLADRSIAQIRRRLRILLEQGEVDVLHDGKALLPMAPGLDAQIVVHRGHRSEPGAALRVPVDRNTSGFADGPSTDGVAGLIGPAFSRTWLQFAGGGYESPNSASLTLELPHALHLRDAEHEAVVTFVPNPFSG